MMNDDMQMMVIPEFDPLAERAKAVAELLSCDYAGDTQESLVNEAAKILIESMRPPKEEHREHDMSNVTMM